MEGLRAPGSSSRKRGMYLVSKNTHRTCVRFARTEQLDQPAMSTTISRFARASRKRTAASRAPVLCKKEEKREKEGMREQPEREALPFFRERGRKRELWKRKYKQANEQEGLEGAAEKRGVALFQRERERKGSRYRRLRQSV